MNAELRATALAPAEDAPEASLVELGPASTSVTLAVIAAREHERSRWASELHDETLQKLAVIRALLRSALGGDRGPAAADAVRRGIERFGTEIRSLRHLIA